MAGKQLVCSVRWEQHLAIPFLCPRGFGINRELVAAFAEERDHLTGQRRMPSAPEVVVAEPMTAARA